MKSILTIIIFILSFLIQTALAGNCEPTPHRTTGTHYKPVTIEKVDLSEGIIVKGRILSAADCQPIPHAKIARWQGGESGRYEDHLYAFMFADEQGRYEYSTEWPNLPTPHIHFIVSADGFKSVETQWIGDKRQYIIEFDIVLMEEN